MITLDRAIELMEVQVGELQGSTGVVLYADDILCYLKAFRDLKHGIERTAKATPFDKNCTSFWATDGRCEGCGYYLERKYSYCPNCGARLEWNR